MFPFPDEKCEEGFFRSRIAEGNRGIYSLAIGNPTSITEYEEQIANTPPRHESWEDDLYRAVKIIPTNVATWWPGHKHSMNPVEFRDHKVTVIDCEEVAYCQH